MNYQDIVKALWLPNNETHTSQKLFWPFITPLADSVKISELLHIFLCFSPLCPPSPASKIQDTSNRLVVQFNNSNEELQLNSK